MHFGQPPDDRQADAEAAVGAGARPVGLAEGFEHVGHELRVDARARVAHAQRVVAVRAGERNHDAAAGSA